MKVLLDMPVSATLLEVLRQHGHDGVHAYQLDMHCASDEDLVALARRENRVVITADLDFPRMLALTNASGPGVILFRGGSYSNAEMRHLLKRVLQTIPEEVLQGSICVVDRKRVRVTSLPLKP